MIKAKKARETKVERDMNGKKIKNYIHTEEEFINVTVYGENAKDLFDKFEEMVLGIAESTGCPGIDEDEYNDTFVVDKDDLKEFNEIYKSWKKGN